jgi:hypothetical protein
MTRLFVMLVPACVDAGFVIADDEDNVLRIYSQPGQLMGNVTTSQAVQ